MNNAFSYFFDTFYRYKAYDKCIYCFFDFEFFIVN